MRSDKYKSVSDRDLAEQYLAVNEGDKSSVEAEIITRFIDAKAKPRTAKAAAKNMMPVVIGAYIGGILGSLLKSYAGNIGELLLESIGYLIGALIVTAFMMIYTVIKNKKNGI